MEEPACTSFESWGVSDKYTWRGTSQHPLPFDENLNRKDAVDSMLIVLGAEPASDDGAAVVVRSDCCWRAWRCGDGGWLPWELQRARCCQQRCGRDGVHCLCASDCLLLQLTIAAHCYAQRL